MSPSLDRLTVASMDEQFRFVTRVRATATRSEPALKDHDRNRREGRRGDDADAVCARRQLSRRDDTGCVLEHRGAMREP